MKEDRARIHIFIDTDDKPKTPKKPPDDGKPHCRRCGKVLTADDLMDTARWGLCVKCGGKV